MKVYDAPALRNVALVGHSGAGKTQLLSALLQIVYRVIATSIVSRVRMTSWLEAVDLGPLWSGGRKVGMERVPEQA